MVKKYAKEQIVAVLGKANKRKEGLMPLVHTMRIFM